MCPESKEMMKDPPIPERCQRCGNIIDVPCKHWRTIDGTDSMYEDDPDGAAPPEDMIEWIWVCWRCDYELINGAPMCIDEIDLHQQREEQDYEEDPLNNPLPTGWQH